MSDVSSVPSRATSPVPDLLHTARPYRFTWDPAARIQGPASVAGTTEGGRGDDFAASPHPMAFLSTTTLALPNEWSSAHTGFHAISTVLNNPHKRQAPPKAHSLLPPVPPASLPRVRRKDFGPYLTAVSPEWDRYQHNIRHDIQAQIENDPQWTPRNSFAYDNADATTPTRRTSVAQSQNGSAAGAAGTRNMPPLDSVPAVFFQKAFDLSDPRTFATVTEQPPDADPTSVDPLALAHALPLLERLDRHADTVEQHLVRELGVRAPSFFAALTNLHDLQAESARCLARVGALRAELAAVDEGSARQGLRLVRAAAGHANLKKVQDGVKMVGGVVEMTGVAKGLVHAGQWGEALGVIEELERMWEADGGDAKQVNGVNGTSHARSASPLPPMREEDEDDNTQRNHLSNTDSSTTPRSSSRRPSTSTTSTLNATTPTPLSKSPPPAAPIPLSSLHAFSALPTHLRTLTLEIAAALAAELVAVLRGDLEARIAGRPEGRKGSGLVVHVEEEGVDVNGLSLEEKEKEKEDEGLKDRLKPLLMNLVRTKGLKEGVLSWREAVLGVVRGIVKEILPAFDGDEDESTRTDSRTGLGDQLRGMDPPEFLEVIQRVYRRLLNGVEGLQRQSTIVVEVLAAISSQSHQPQSPPDLQALEADLADIVSSAAELANTQAARVIAFRAERHASLPLDDFLVFFNDSWAFVIKCETVCRRMIVGLRGTVVGQAKLFLQTFHQTRISASAKLVEDEQWNPAEITPALQHIVDVIVDSAVRDPPDVLLDQHATTVFTPAPAAIGAFGVASPTPTPTISSPLPPPSASTTSPLAPSSAHQHHSTKHLRIEDRSYFAVSATASMLGLLLDYLRVVVNLPLLTPDTMGKVIEFLKAFNSRTCQVVLGAGAMRSAGLKNITAKHLALASQSLSIVYELIPYVRETFRRHLSQKQAVMLVEFDKLKRDYQEHQNEIHSKLVAIMGDRLNAHIKSLKMVDWSVPKPGGGINDYMEILVKETVTLHKVLSRYLSPPVVEYVMTQVFAAINHRLSEEYGLIELPHQEAKTRLLADARYLHQKLSALRNVGAPTGMLETVVAEKSIPRAPGSSPPQAAASSSSGGGSSAGNGNGSANANSTQPQMLRSNTLNANQRLKGLLSGRALTFAQSHSSGNIDKALPPPQRTESPPPMPPPSGDKPLPPRGSSLLLRSQSSLNVNSTASSIFGASNMSVDRLTNDSSQVSLVEPEAAGSSAGFKQVEAPPSPNPDVGAGGPQ
ncbi:Vps54-domain-containing protein [Pholiota conissans]|uniref:Vps54-domain-containing protein n=1 Tax=Pholiota conissans TaxID=109636 RepID=A0A9P5ZBM1_9AGAR|nr:Vps54-domain-containing protein [Pholiota conissans]